MFGVVFASGLCAFGTILKRFKIKSRLKCFKMAPKAHKQKQTQHQTQGKSVLFIFFENIIFRTYFVNFHTLS